MSSLAEKFRAAADEIQTRHDALVGLAERWQNEADRLDDETGLAAYARAYQLRRDAADLLEILGVIDCESSASRQHYIDTGRYLRYGEEA